MYIQNNENDIINILNKVDSIDIYREGNVEKIGNDENKFSTIMSHLVDNFSNGIILPALGVALHDEMVNEIKSDKWIKLNFAYTMSIDDLPFDSLIFKVGNVQGMNIFRENNGRIEGRCIYIDFLSDVDFSTIVD